MIDRSEQRCGFMAVLGAPNVGKSTLVNRLVGTKVSIVSPKVQTTRTRVLGIRMEQSAQLVFIDTPGVFVPKRRLDRAMVASAWGGAADADRILLMIDATKGIDADSKMILDKLRAQDKTALLVINKIDLIDKQNLLDLTDRLSQSGSFSDIFMISAQTGDGVKDLLARLVESAPLGPWMYPEDQISDMPSRLLAA
ncbi:MAG TPA: GTPase Era, partial [Rhodospirillales bacterium]|nr:GTPase Era [Rhodospirillales bacterium]